MAIMDWNANLTLMIQRIGNLYRMRLSEHDAGRTSAFTNAPEAAWAPTTSSRRATASARPGAPSNAHDGRVRRRDVRQCYSAAPR